MYLIYADDSMQMNPYRFGIGPLMAVGGFIIPGNSVSSLIKRTDYLCNEAGFPPEEEFKWSPNRGTWLYDHLKGNKRVEFFKKILVSSAALGARAIVVVIDIERWHDMNGVSPRQIAKKWFLERVELELRRIGPQGIIKADRPGGGRREENKFTFKTLQTLQGTEFVPFRQIIKRIDVGSSKADRLLQVADVITSCTTQMVAGEKKWAPPVFEEIKKMLCRKGDQIGGFGLKIHPDYKHRNLHYWLVGDSRYDKRGNLNRLPQKGFPYYASPWVAT